MKKEEKHLRTKKILLAFRRYAIFFLAMSFFITCCLVLFLNTMQYSAGIVIERESIETAAKITFANVIVLSLICTAADAVRRAIMVKRPVKKITDFAQKIMSGDFSARIKKEDSAFLTMGDFEEIADYFNDMAQELSGIETLQNDFTANVSHEMKTPLAVIRNYAALLKSPELSDEERMEYADETCKAADKLSALVTNILKLNKLENRQIFPEKEKYDLGEQLCECLLQFESEWERKGLEIETDIEDGITVSADSELLSIVWSNLFSNAVKFTDRGKIRVSLKKDGDFAKITVADTGRGISAKDGKHIFEKFYQADTSRATGGNGLGLALVKRVIDIEGADISVESEPGKGSIFTVRIPV